MLASYNGIANHMILLFVGQFIIFQINLYIVFFLEEDSKNKLYSYFSRKKK